MANAAGLINEGLWRKDRDFQRLPRLVQCTFLQVLSQKDLDTAGVLTLHLELLAKGCDELTTEQLRSDLAVLGERRFVFVDYDTDELLIRSYVRIVSVNSPNAWRSVPKNARLVASEKLRHELATELRRLRKADATALANEIDPHPTPSGPRPNPVETPSEGDNPSEGGPNPPSQVPVQVKSSVGNGSPWEGEPPSPYCPDHPNGTPRACLKCQRCREESERWVSGKTAFEKALRAAAAERRRNCEICGGSGWVDLDDDTGVTDCECKTPIPNLQLVHDATNQRRSAS
ncbi:Uncharacterised protein [Mycobacteroides abscessus subsp. massiliense]|nr:Uncharacterised protein [Mycobacteroides abscessus subsp. massiliense]SKY71712.1 Uncharacterised protein [Mycobacteroides abscessus subsp. massiliense]